MAVRVAVPNYPTLAEEPALPTETVGERRARLEAYLALDPAIRFVIALALVAAISLLYLVQMGTVAELNYQVQGQIAERTKLVREQQSLQLEIARAQALPRIENEARTRLKLVPLGKEYRYLEVPPAP